MEMNPVTIESFAASVQALQAQLAEANQKIETHQSEVSMAAQRVQTVERELPHATPSEETGGLKATNKPTWFIQRKRFCQKLDIANGKLRSGH